MWRERLEARWTFAQPSRESNRRSRAQRFAGMELPGAGQEGRREAEHLVQDDVQEVRVGCESCGALLSVRASPWPVLAFSVAVQKQFKYCSPEQQQLRQICEADVSWFFSCCVAVHCPQVDPGEHPVGSPFELLSSFKYDWQVGKCRAPVALVSREPYGLLRRSLCRSGFPVHTLLTHLSSFDAETAEGKSMSQPQQSTASPQTGAEVQKAMIPAFR